MASSSPSTQKENLVASVSNDYGKDGLVLRPYQEDGICWLIKTWLRGSGDGGLLCDDMGLGKTCQTIHMLKYIHTVAETPSPSIVVVPLSVFKNWQEEFSMWAPKLELIAYTGSKDERPILQERISKKLNQKECKMIILCTPELLINDEEFFLTLNYAALVFDEAQRVKNADSILYRICKSLRKHSCLLMTGTPVQNNLRELYALLSLAAPSKFPQSHTDSFICRHANLVTDVKIQTQLQTEIAPYMLRRIKSEVEPNLPSRGVVHLYVNLTDLQKKLYRSILARNIEALTGSIKTSRNNVQNALVSLRKCVDHPYLFDGVEPEPFEAGEHLVTASGKLIVLDRLLGHLKKLGHRVLIFSQMTHMLDILQDYLTYRKHLYERLDGSVRGEERYLAVSNFCRKGSESSKQPFIFLLSTRAGGVGLNLVTADTVVLFDSDMNPQNDLQAIARAHRIGQTKAVKVIRFVSRYTVEENILRRQSAKIVLSEAVMGGAPSSSDFSSGSMLPNSESRNWWKEVLRVGLDKLFDDSASGHDAIDFDAILGQTDAHGNWTDEELPRGHDDGLADAQAEKEAGSLTEEDLTAPLVEKLRLEAEQIKAEEAAKKAPKLDLLPEGKRKLKKTEFLADEMLTEESERPPRKTGPKVDPAIRRAQAKEKLWQRLNYSSCNLPLPQAELSSHNPLEVSDEEEDSQVENCRGSTGGGVHFVVGDVTKPHGHVASNEYCIVCCWVDDGGSWGSGGVFTAVDSSLGDEPAKAYELSHEAKDLNVGDVHLVEINDQTSCALLVCQHRKTSGDHKPIDLSHVETAFKRLKAFASDKNKPVSIHLPRIGRGALAANWYGIERLIRKWFAHGPVKSYVYYFSRTKTALQQPSSGSDENSNAQEPKSASLQPAVSIFDGLRFCLIYLPDGCRARQHIENVVAEFGGKVDPSPDDDSNCYIIVDRSDLAQDSLDRIKNFPRAHAVHYSWMYSCEKRQQLVNPTQFTL